MHKLLLLFGNTSKLSELEFRALYPDLLLRPLHGPLFLVESSDDISKDLSAALGGLVKVFILRQTVAANTDDQELTEVIAGILLTDTDEPYFTLSQFGKRQRSISNADIKRFLKEQGHKARYFSSELSDSALLSHHSDATEVLLYHDQEQEQVLLAQLTGVQDIDDWTKRDRSKPYADRKKGMLPPKVARMMVNSALGFWQQAHPGQQARLYDPFCGTGTVLLEAAMRGLAVYGSDIDERAVFGSRDNLAWLNQEYGLSTESEVFYADAGHIDPKLFTKPVDLLVTEPFLGKQTPRDSELANVFRGLEKMYLGSFKSFAQVLSDGAIVTIVFPFVTTDKRTYGLSGLIDKLQAKGYNLLVDPVTYAREGARVARQIYIFRFQRG